LVHGRVSVCTAYKANLKAGKNNPVPFWIYCTYTNEYVYRVCKNPVEYITILLKISDIIGTSASSFFGILLINSLLCKEISKTKKQIMI